MRHSVRTVSSWITHLQFLHRFLLLKNCTTDVVFPPAAAYFPHLLLRCTELSAMSVTRPCTRDVKAWLCKLGIVAPRRAQFSHSPEVGSKQTQYIAFVNQSERRATIVCLLAFTSTPNCALDGKRKAGVHGMHFDRFKSTCVACRG